MSLLQDIGVALNTGEHGMSDTIDIVFDGPPSHESGRFVEVEDSEGASINFGEWVERDDGYWVLRIPDSRALIELNKNLVRDLDECQRAHDKLARISNE